MRSLNKENLVYAFRINRIFITNQYLLLIVIFIYISNYLINSLYSSAVNSSKIQEHNEHLKNMF